MDNWGNHTELPTDSIVVSAGFTAQNDLANALENETEAEVYNIGDSHQARQTYDAIHEGFFAAKQI